MALQQNCNAVKLNITDQRHIREMWQHSLVAFSLLLTTVSSHWLPPSAFSKERSVSGGEENVSNLGVLRRVERDIDHCGPDDPIPPNRVNTSVQVQISVLVL